MELTNFNKAVLKDENKNNDGNIESETVLLRNENKIKITKKGEKKKLSKGNIFFNCFKLNIGVFIVIISILTLIFKPYDLIMIQHISMREGFPLFALWKRADPEVLLKIYIFNITNSEEFLRGRDESIKFNEIGPVIYQDLRNISNVTRFPDNSSMSYTLTLSPKFRPDLNEPSILNKTIIIPNLSLIAAAGYIQGHSLLNNFLTKMLFNSLIGVGDDVFLKITIQDYLWNTSTPVIKKIVKYFPDAVPRKNSGILPNTYLTDDRLNVKVGHKQGFENFFKINTVNERKYIPFFYPENGDCPALAQGASDGSLFPCNINESSVLQIYRKSSCAVYSFVFDEKQKIGLLSGNKYVLAPNTYSRRKPLSLDCHKGSYGKIHPDGFHDVSKCYSNLPVLLSAPHFYGYNLTTVSERFKGFHPSKELHQSYMIIEPSSGVPLRQSGKSQINYYIPKLSGFNKDIQKFSDMYIPQNWMDYYMAEETPLNEYLIFAMIVVVPIAQYAIAFILLCIGFQLIISIIIKTKHKHLEYTRQRIVRWTFNIKEKSKPIL